MSELIIFDPQNSGHHPEFLRHLRKPAAEAASANRLVRLVVHPQTCLDEDQAPGASAGRPADQPASFRIERLPTALHGDGKLLPDSILAQKQIDFLIQSSSEESVHIFFPRLNTYLPALLTLPEIAAATRPGTRYTLSGILFAPSSASWCHPGCRMRHRMTSCREIVRLRQLGRRSGLTKLFILNDPATASFIERFTRLQDGVLPVADPISDCGAHAWSPPDSTPAAESAPADSRSTRFLLIGAMRPGKGVIATLQNFTTWHPPRSTGKIHLVLAGEIAPAFRAEVDKLINKLRQSKPSLGLEIRFRSLGAQEWNSLIHEADYLLLPYTRPLGSSGILGHAARAGKPVLATSEGLIGTLVRNYRLGATFRLGSQQEWHHQLSRAVAQGIPVDPAGRVAYQQANSVESFQATLALHWKQNQE